MLLGELTNKKKMFWTEQSTVALLIYNNRLMRQCYSMITILLPYGFGNSGIFIII